MEKNRKQTDLFIILLYAVIILSMIAYAIFLHRRIRDNVKQDAMQITSEYAGVLNAEMSEQQIMLRTVGEMISGDALFNTDPQNELKKACSVSGFDYLCFTDDSGTWSTADDLDVKSIMSNEAFSEAKNGSASVSGTAVEITKGVKAVAMYTPVYSDGEVRGVLTGCITADSVGKMLAMDVNTKSVFILIDDETNVLGINNDSKFKVQGYDFNTFLNRFKYKNRKEADNIRAALKEGGFDSLRYSYYGEEKYLSYYPFGISNWYLIKFISYTDARAPYLPMFNGFIVMCVAIIAALVFAAFLIRGYSSIILALEESNQRYERFNKEKNSVTYTYNRTSRAVELNGAVEEIFGKEFANLKSVNLMTLLEKLHPEDQNFVKVLRKKLDNGEKQFANEIRIMNPEGEYGWYKISGILFGDNGITIVGNVQSSDEEIDREHALRRKAETDLLTGLLNKITMEDSVNALISEKPHGVYYFYIIDLDNFKEVNDNLGHAMGDTVLVEVADKLRQIFSEFDRIGRIGGDEFAVLLNVPENMNLANNNLVEIKAKAINNSLRNTYSDGDKRVNVSASIGISRYDENNRDYGSLYKSADEILYYSKKHGKDQYNICDSTDGMKGE